MAHVTLGAARGVPAVSRILLLTRPAEPLMRLAGMQEGTAAAVGGLLVVDLGSRPAIFPRESPVTAMGRIAGPSGGGSLSRALAARLRMDGARAVARRG